MKKLLLFCSLLLLTACGPNEADFKSTVAPTARNDIAFTADVAEDPTETVVADEEPVEKSTEELVDETTEEPTGRADDTSTEEPIEKQVAELPEQINLDVPFYPQAPDADWGMPWQEACEEASLILAYYYATNQSLSKAEFKDHIWGLVEWQNKNFGDYIHSSTSQNAEMLKGYFEYDNFEIIENPTIEDMKRELAAGHPIVAPFAGRLLENPFFTAPGPYYHVFVIKGYDGKNFIVNDVGTRRGENFMYSYENILSSLHDYDVDKDINDGDKRIIILK